MAERVWYLEDDVTVGLVELSMERFIHLERKKIFYLPYSHTRNLKEGEIKKKEIKTMAEAVLLFTEKAREDSLPGPRHPGRTQSSPDEVSLNFYPTGGSSNLRILNLHFPKLHKKLLLNNLDIKPVGVLLCHAPTSRFFFSCATSLMPFSTCLAWSSCEQSFLLLSLIFLAKWSRGLEPWHVNTQI